MKFRFTRARARPESILNFAALHSSPLLPPYPKEVWRRGHSLCSPALLANVPYISRYFKDVHTHFSFYFRRRESGMAEWSSLIVIVVFSQ